MTNTESSIEEKLKFEIDLRVEGVPEVVILKIKINWKRSAKRMEKLKIDSFTKFIREDLKKEHTEMTKSQIE